LRLLNLRRPDGTYLFPTPQVIDRSQPFALQGFSALSSPCTFNEDQYMLNLDYLQTDKGKFVGRLFYATSRQLVPFARPEVNVEGSPINLPARFTVASVAHSYVFNPRVFNELRVGGYVPFQMQRTEAAFKYSDMV
jgi:hypothetical protein